MLYCEVVWNLHSQSTCLVDGKYMEGDDIPEIMRYFFFVSVPCLELVKVDSFYQQMNRSKNSIDKESALVSRICKETLEFKGGEQDEN